ncbi:MAG: hypothetical protein KC466_00210 [Myxococcales bacterium]|nr:hypothetical protein [Myxococcales bacterium]
MGSARQGWLVAVGTFLTFLAGAVLTAPGWSPSRAEAAEPTAAFDPHQLDFTVKFNGESSAYDVLGLYVLPGEALTFEVPGARSGAFRLTADEGAVGALGPGRWRWRAPNHHGLHRIRITRVGGATMTLNAFVLVPARQVRGGMLNGYRIGEYPKKPFKGQSIYEPPRGFVEVTEANRDTLVAPHFRLGQFLCKADGGWPKYLILRERLLLKLELILEEVNKRGFRADGFHVMSGYRTPAYNAAIGNGIYSRHLWGGAADIFIDVNPADGVMDDLNGDGRIDVEDSGVLKDIVESLHDRPLYERFIGGLARYVPTPAHGPFVHVDARGWRARWGP